MHKCIDCGADTKPGKGSARCEECWDSRLGNPDVKFNKSGTVVYVDKEKANAAANKTFEKLQELAKPVENDEYYLHLIIQLINTARQNKMEEYRKTKKEIKRLQLENKEAKEFFRVSFISLKI